MSTPELRPAENGTFYAYWSENRRSRRKSMGTKDRAVAETRFGQWLVLGGHKGQVSEEGRAGLTVAELWQVYNARHVQKETEAPASIEYAWANLEQHFGPLLPADIDQSVTEDYGERREHTAPKARHIGRKVVASTVRKELGALRACFNWHASPERGRKRLLEMADVPAFKLPKEADPRERWLTTAEIQQLFAAARALHPNAERMTRGERFLWLALETAARKQAILDLTWGRVDFETGTIHFAVPGKKQTKKRRSSVPISNALMSPLKQMYAERTGDLVMDHDAEVWSTIQAIVIKAGLAPKLPRATGERIKSTGISPHTFRHTAATHMARRGVPLYDIAGVLGNTVAMVEKVYAKHCPDRLRAAINAISSGVLEAAE